MSLQRLENLNLRMIEKHFPHLHNAVNNLARAIFVLIPISILCLIYRICFIIRYLNLDPYQKIDLNRHQNTIKKFLTSHNLWNSFDCPQAIKMSLNGLFPKWFPDWKLVWKRLGLINCLVRFVTVMQGVPDLPLLLKQWQNHKIDNWLWCLWSDLHDVVLAYALNTPLSRTNRWKGLLQ